MSAVSETDIWTVGGSQHKDKGHALIRHWNGHGWEFARAPNGDPSMHDVLYGVSAVSASDVWAVGLSREESYSQPLAMHWDGQKWSITQLPQSRGNGALSAVYALSSDDVWAVGQAANQEKVLIDHWDGSSWQKVGSPHAGEHPTALTAISGSSPTDLWAVGFTGSHSVDVPLVEHWDGSSWSIASTPDTDGTAGLYDVAEVSPDDVWAVVWDVVNVHGDVEGPTVIEHYDGASWTVEDNPSPGLFNTLLAVDYVDAGDIWAVGDSTDGAGAQSTLYEHWDGSRWEVVPVAPFGRDSRLTDVLTFSHDQAWAVGTYLNDRAFRSLQQHWDGSSWKGY